jgi:hypothetical protein
MSNRDKYLTEAMGECWHTITNDNYCCPLCGELFNCPKGFDPEEHINFSTWEGFGKLWEFCQKQEWWENFRVFNHYQDENGEYMESRYDINESLVNPDRFADTVYRFLMEE